MPRPNRAQGRPGTKVFPDKWETSHAVVVRKTCRATIKITVSGTSTATPALDASYKPINPPALATLYEGGARIQVLNGQEAATLTADQDQITVGYLVVIDRDSADIPFGATVQILTAEDPTLLGDRRLIVRKVARGSERWERDLWCVDDITRSSD